jgi:hypothetical protein
VQWGFQALFVMGGSLSATVLLTDNPSIMRRAQILRGRRPNPPGRVGGPLHAPLALAFATSSFQRDVEAPAIFGNTIAAGNVADRVADDRRSRQAGPYLSGLQLRPGSVVRGKLLRRAGNFPRFDLAQINQRLGLGIVLQPRPLPDVA